MVNIEKNILGKQVHHRILRSYSMLMTFALKVHICESIRQNMEYETNDIINTCQSKISSYLSSSLLIYTTMHFISD